MAAADVVGLQMVATDDGHGPIVGGEIAVVVSVIEAVVEEVAGPVVPSERAPADVVPVGPPMHPGRAPMGLGDPVPAEAEAPIPAAVVISRPAPGLGGNPVPADDGIPDPAAVVIRLPILIVGDVRDPDVAVGPFIDPVAVLVAVSYTHLRAHETDS